MDFWVGEVLVLDFFFLGQLVPLLLKRVQNRPFCGQPSHFRRFSYILQKCPWFFLLRFESQITILWERRDLLSNLSSGWVCGWWEVKGCRRDRQWELVPPPPLFFDLLVHFGFFASYTNCCNLWLLFYYGWGDLLGKIGNKKKIRKWKKSKCYSLYLNLSLGGERAKEKSHVYRRVKLKWRMIEEEGRKGGRETPFWYA